LGAFFCGLSQKNPEIARTPLSREQQEYLSAHRVAAANRLHALYAQMGIVVTRKDLKNSGRRAAWMGKLPELRRYLAEMPEKEPARYVMPVPGVGIGLAAVFLAYLGDGRQFNSAAQAACYAGFTPRVDSSGQMVHYGHISRRNYSRSKNEKSQSRML
jgi:transposase